MNAWPRRPINVLEAWREKHAFRLIEHDQIVVRHVDAGGEDVPPDIIVVPTSRWPVDTRKLVDSVSRAAWARVAAGHAALVFDSSPEGAVHDPHFQTWIRDIMRRVGVAPDRCAYITQDRSYRKAHAAYCAQNDLRPMKVLNYDYFIRLFFLRVEAKGQRVFEARRQAFEARPATRPRRFISLNLSPRTAKLMMLLRLIRDGLWDQGYISFPGFNKSVNAYAIKMLGSRRDLRRLPGFEDLAFELEPHMAELAAYGSVLLGEVRPSNVDPSQIQPPVNDTPLPEYDRSWFTIVPETEMIGPRRITEKPLKSLVNFQPLIILGNVRSMALLREFGFKTFDGYFDEAYDVEPNARRRFDMVYEEVRRLCALPEAELNRMERQWAETLTYNAHWGLTRLPQIYRERIDPALVESVLDLIDDETAPKLDRNWSAGAS